jgi:ribosomal protein S18 acetylase RimI-like enzyme
VKIKSFDSLSQKNYFSLSNFDKELVKKYGNSFSNEIWNEINFKYRLPEKEKLSFAFFDEYKLIGYIVSSTKNNSVYIHRFAVSKKGFSKEIFEEVMERYKEKSIYLMVNIININAISFYQSFNFNILTDENFIKKFILNELQVEKNEILIAENYKCFLMKRN